MGSLSYYLTVENAVSATVKNLVVSEPEAVAAVADHYFTEKYDWLKLKIRNLKFTEITPLR